MLKLKKNALKKIILFALLVVAVIVSCQKEPLPRGKVEIDRSAILESWADNIIIPAHEAYNATTVTLHSHTEAFFDAPTLANLEAVRSSWFESYKAWQNVPFFIEGKGVDSEVLISFYANVYPVNTSKVDYFLDSGTYDLTITANKNAQGFPALDYMLYGLAETEEDILSFYTSNIKAEQYKQFLVDLTARTKALSTVIYEDWINGYRDIFVANTESNKSHFNRNISSIEKVVNDFIYSYEFDIRTSKIGFPSGACFGCDGETRKAHIEAPYRGDISKVLLLEALDAAQDFYNGVAFKGKFEERGPSLYHYVDLLDTQKNGEKLSDLINKQFDKSRAAIEKLSDDFASDLENRNELMVEVHTELQLNVLYLKNCMMMDAMDISFDYVSG